MANTYSTQFLVDSHKKTIVKFTSGLDTFGETANVKIIGKNLFGALATDTNNAVLVSNGGTAKTNYRYGITRIVGVVNTGSTGFLQINWDGAVGAPIAALAGSFDINLAQQGGGTITNNANTPNGNISFTTTGVFTNAASYTIILELHKDGRDYNQGQIERPSEFNFGTYSVKP